MTGDRSAKLLDLGIARGPGSDEVETAVGGSADTRLTQLGAIVGSPSYMSPEQLAAQPLDVRTDLYSLGLVLYECLGGGRYEGDDIAYQPIDVAEHGFELNQVLARALAFDRNNRYQAASQFLRDIRALGTGEMLANLPSSMFIGTFENLTGREDDQWIGTAIAETVRADLGRCEDVWVVARKPQNKNARLSSRWSLAGGFQRAGDKLRVTAELVDVASEEVMATFKRDAEAGDIFVLQDNLSAWVAATLELSLTPASRAAGRQRARELTDRAMDLSWSTHGREAMNESVRMLEEALRVDPSYAPAHSWLGQTLALSGVYIKMSDVAAKAEKHLRRAIELDPESGQPHTWLGYLYFSGGDPGRAVDHLARGCELDPDEWSSHYFAGASASFAPRSSIEKTYRSEVGGDLPDDLHRWNRLRSVRYLQRALELHPSNSFTFWILGMVMLDLERGPEAIFCIEEAIRHEPSSVLGTAGCGVFLGVALRRLGRLNDAREAILAGLESVESKDQCIAMCFASSV